MFEKFRKKKDESKPVPPNKDEEFTAETVQYQRQEFKAEDTSEVMEQQKPIPPEIKEQPKPRPPEQVKMPEQIQQASTSTGEEIGIRALMDKRTKLEEAIDYVGLMIKNLKDKRTKLEKNI